MKEIPKDFFLVIASNLSCQELDPVLLKIPRKEIIRNRRYLFDLLFFEA
jgi:hypothetical protein